MTCASRQIVNFRGLIQAAKLAPIEISENLRNAIVPMVGIGESHHKKIVLEDLPDVISLFTLIRQRAWQTGFLEMPRLRQSGHTFITGQRYRILPTVTPLPPTETTTEPWYIDMGLSYVGETSFYTTAALCLQNQVVVDSLNAWAYVDKESRRKARLPDWFREKCSTDKAKRPNRIEMPTVMWPVDMPLNTHTISNEDLDHFGHVNHSNYVSYSVDSLTELLNSSKSSDNSGRNISYSWPLEQADIVFSGESKAGDRLDVATLPTVLGPSGGRFLSQIRKNGSHAPIAQVHFTLSSAIKVKSCI